MQMFSDNRPDPMLQFVSQFSGLNPAPGDSCLMSFTDAFKLFFEDELFGKLCERMNERAAQFFADNPEDMCCVNGIIWCPVTHDDM